MHVWSGIERADIRMSARKYRSPKYVILSIDCGKVRIIWTCPQQEGFVVKKLHSLAAVPEDQPVASACAPLL
jgi:hypothetical protein